MTEGGGVSAHEMLTRAAELAAGQPRPFKGAYRGEVRIPGGQTVECQCLLALLGTAAGLHLEGDEPTNPPPWYADPHGYQGSPLAQAIGHLADVCRRVAHRGALDANVLAEINGRIGVGDDDPMNYSAGDAFDRACVAAFSDGKHTSTAGCVKALSDAAAAANKGEKR